MCLSMALAFALSFYFCCDAQAGVKLITVPKPCKEIAIIKKCAGDKQPELKLKADNQADQTSIFSKLLSFEIPKTAFGDFVLSAQKALLEKLSNREDEQQPAAQAQPAPPASPSGKTSQYLKNGILRI